MCGIAGIWGDQALPDAEQRLRSMLQAIRHRGPDGTGLTSFDGGAAGMVRLALVDLSDRGMQPIWSADGQVAIVFNGEMYNHAAERERLKAKGFTFKSTSDTEVVLSLYLERGEAFVERLRGMFALAIVDWRGRPKGSTPKLLLARDPFGIKPLYLAERQGRLVFASELKGLVASGLVEPEIDRDGLRDYLSFGFVMQPRSILRGVTVLERGFLEVREPGKPMQRSRFYMLPAPSDAGLSFADAARRLREVIEESVRLHALADAPVGAFLSGGVDSSMLVALMSKHNSRLRTYTIRLEDPRLDESREAAAFAKQWGCVHTEVELREADLPELFPKFAAQIDQPSTDGINTWLVSRAAAKDVKGVLSGLGGDEWFGGYPVLRRMAALERGTGRWLKRAGGLARRLGHLPGALDERLQSLKARSGPLEMWAASHRLFSPAEVGRLLGEPEHDVDPWLHIAASKMTDPVELALNLDVLIYMGRQLLRDSDATSMASSLELRVPLVDVELARFVRTCPAGYRFDAGHIPSSKRMLLEAMRDVLPADIHARPKRGFSMPATAWVKGALSPLIDDTLASLSKRGLLSEVPARQKLEPYPQAWGLALLEMWVQSLREPTRVKTASAA